MVGGGGIWPALGEGGVCGVASPLSGRASVLGGGFGVAGSGRVVWLTSGVVVLTLVLAQRVYRAGIWSGKAVLGLWSRRLSGQRGGDGSGEACLWVPTFIWEGVFMHGGEESESAKAGVGPLITS